MVPLNAPLPTGNQPKAGLASDGWTGGFVIKTFPF